MAQKRKYSVTEAERILKDVGAMPEDVAVLKDMTIHQDMNTGEWLPKGVWNIDAIADLRTNPGKAILRAGTQITKDNVPEDVYAAWLETEKIAPRYKITAITTRREVKNVIQLLYTLKETDIYELVDHGGFNRQKNHNNPGVDAKEPITDTVDKETEPAVKKRKQGRESRADKRVKKQAGTSNGARAN